LVIALAIMPADRPCVASNRFVMILEFRDRVAAEARLVVANADVVVGDPLAVDVDLRVALAELRHAARLVPAGCRAPASRGPSSSGR
jgi:hypothetical protein